MSHWHGVSSSLHSKAENIKVVLTTTNDDFVDARQETSYYSILNFFYFVKAKFVKIYFTYAGYRYVGLVEHVESDSIQLSLSAFNEGPERRANLNFEALNRYYSATVTILRSNEMGVFIQIPKEIRYLARREHIRLSYDDLFMRFIILYSPIMETRQAEKTMEGRYPYFMTEVLQDNPSVRIVYQMFLTEVRKISKEFDVKMIYASESTDFTLPEKYILQTGKSFLIEDVSKTSSYVQELPSDSVINYREWYREQVKLNGEYASLLKIEEIKNEDARNFLVSYLLVPISLFGSPIGYLRIETNQFNKHNISVFDAEELHVLAGLFSYALTKVRIRRSHFDPSSMQTRVVNISLSGLLMELTDKVLYHYLQKHRRVKMLIPILGEEIEVFGEIKRFFTQKDLFYMGVTFFKSRPGDISRLENFLYEDLHHQFF